jgi:hypothetical protein
VVYSSELHDRYSSRSNTSVVVKISYNEVGIYHTCTHKQKNMHLKKFVETKHLKDKSPYQNINHNEQCVIKQSVVMTMHQAFIRILLYYET